MLVSKSKTLPDLPSHINETYDELLTQLSSEEYLVLSFGSYEAAFVAYNIVKARIRQLRLKNVSLTQKEEALYLRQESSFTLSEEDKDKLLSQIEKIDGGCWMWLGPQSAGYGVPFIQGRQRLAHRLFYLMQYGGKLKGLRLRNACDNRGCVNPHHFTSSRDAAPHNLPDNFIDVTIESDGSFNIPKGYVDDDATPEESTE